MSPAQHELEECDALIFSSRTIRVWLKRDSGQYWPSIYHTVSCKYNCRSSPRASEAIVRMLMPFITVKGGAFSFDFSAPSAPCSCMSYHHDSRRIFIGQDNGAVVVSEANNE